MGMSINLESYDLNRLIKEIEKVEERAGRPDRTTEYFVVNILPEFGNVSYTAQAEPVFITMWNEYYEDYNPASQMMRAVDLYFGVYDTYFGFSVDTYGANAYEVLEALGIEPIVVDNDEEV